MFKQTRKLRLRRHLPRGRLTPRKTLWVLVAVPFVLMALLAAITAVVSAYDQDIWTALDLVLFTAALALFPVWVWEKKLKRGGPRN